MNAKANTIFFRTLLKKLTFTIDYYIKLMYTFYEVEKINESKK